MTDNELTSSQMERPALLTFDQQRIDERPEPGPENRFPFFVVVHQFEFGRPE
jgi:hypothetical protein